MDREQCEKYDIRLIGTMETPYGPADLLWGRHFYGGRPFVLLQFKDGKELTALSVNLVVPNRLLGDNEFYVKTSTENAEFVPLALATGFFEQTGGLAFGGLEIAPIWRLVKPISK